jgi:hypothetical protein
LIFSGTGTSQQVVQDVAISVTSGGATTAQTATSQTTTQASSTQATTSQSSTQNSTSTGSDGTTGDNGENLALQSYVISAKDNSGAGNVAISVQEGLPAWMEVQTDGSAGTLVLKGERPDGDNTTYQVKVKMKRMDGKEIEAIIKIEPVVKEGDTPDTGQPQEGPEGEADSDDQASLDWLQELVASLDGDGIDSLDTVTQVDPNRSFSNQIATEKAGQTVWQTNLLHS